MFDTSDIFSPGQLSICLDASAGSSGKGKMASFIADHADNWQFCCNTFSAQAGHWVKLDDGRCLFYQTLNSCAYSDKYEKMFIGPGASIELPAFFREMEENNVDPRRVGIHPLASIIQDMDGAFERGEVDFDGVPRAQHDGTMKAGSTCHGVGAARARRVLRRPDLKLVRDVPELQEFVCDTSEEIMQRLDKGQSGLFEIAQGFQLSLMLKDMYPYCTSRNVTVAAGFDDMMLPVRYAGNVILNCRTYPIRINSNKYLDPDTGKHLTWGEVEEYKAKGRDVRVYEGDSGPGYDDQIEISWDELTAQGESPEPIIEMTSVTKLPRRVFTFSRKNLQQAIRYNHTGKKMFISINFANYVDHAMSGSRGEAHPLWQTGALTPKFTKWFKENLQPVIHSTKAIVKFIGTGPLTDDMITLCGD